MNKLLIIVIVNCCIFARSRQLTIDQLSAHGKILKFQNLKELELLKLGHRYICNCLPKPLTKFFNRNDTIHQHHTRLANNFHIHQFQFNYYKKSFLHAVPFLCNTVPQNLTHWQWERIASWHKGRYFSIH